MRRFSSQGAARLAAALSVLLLPALAAAQQSSWVKTGVTGRLIYVPDADGDRIPDFSMVGYGAGKKEIPNDLPVVIRIDPIAGDNTQHVQNAINFAAGRPLGPNGYRGVVELGPGKFDIHGRLNITTSGIVIRGSGSGDSLATNTHIVSQNRTDSFSSASTPVIDIQGSTSGRSYGPQIQVTDTRVPVGAQSLNVASTAGMSVGGMIEIYRPSTAAWIEELGMHLIPDGMHWTAGSRDLRWQRTVTRIEGNTLFFDAPITTALDSQWGGGTVRTYNLPNQIRNVGIENLRGQSLDQREESNEDRTPSFVRFTRVEDGFVRDVETRHFTYASVFASKTDGTQYITVDNVSSRLPAGAVTGGRRYTFAMDAQMSLVKNSFGEAGRHDFVTGSNVTGPIAFINSSTSGTRSDSGPHHRWGNGLLFDNVTIGGNDINVQNRWTSGSGHGWAGANVVVWNSTARSFIVQSPPTANGWLIGSTGGVSSGNCHGVPCAGHRESHGTKVTVGGTQSLHEAQVNDASDIEEFRWSGANGNWNDAMGWNQGASPAVYEVSSRTYSLGEFDNFFSDNRDGHDGGYIDLAWAAAVAQSFPAPIVGFDNSLPDRNTAFTIEHSLSPGERVIHGYLAMSLKQNGSQVSNDFVQLFDMAPQHTLSFNSLGWTSEINATTPYVGVVDLGNYLDQLQDGSVNVLVNDDVGVDWATYTVAVATPKSHPLGAMVFLDGGSVRVDQHVTPIGGLQNGRLRDNSTLTIAATGRLVVNQDFAQHEFSKLIVQIAGGSPNQLGKLVVGDEALLAGTLELELVNGFMPAIGQTFEILSAAGGLLGSQFANTIVADLSGQGVWGIEYQSQGVVAQLLSNSMFGDLDGNGVLDHLDWNQYLAHALADLSGLGLLNGYQRGDLNGDGANNLDDLDLFISTYEAANGVGSFAQMVSGVPEPGGLALVCWAVAGIGAWSARRRRAGR